MQMQMVMVSVTLLFLFQLATVLLIDNTDCDDVLTWTVTLTVPVLL
jgi:hypothetical protein